MAISQNITPLSTPPSRSDPTNFDSRADTFLAELPTLATQINTWAGQANSTASTITSDAGAAATAKTNAETAEAHAETAQGLAEAARDTAIVQAATATSQASAAGVSAGTATAQAVIATAKAVIATDQAAIATTQANNAVAVVTGGTATLTPEGGKIPLSDANALIDGDWIGVNTGKLTTSKDAFAELSAVQEYLILNMEGLAGYWPADPSYIYQDSAGYIPATVGGVVGCWRRLGPAPVYTPVTVTNPGFDTDTGWTKGTGWTIADGVATHVGPTTGNISQAISFTPGATYLITFTVTRSSGNIRPIFFGGTTQYGDYISASGTYSENLVAATGNITLVFEGGADFAGTVDNVTLVSVSNSPALQATTAVKPYLRRTPSSAVYWLDSNTATSALTATLGNLGAACTVARATAEGVTFTEGVTISSTYNIAPVYAFNGDIAIFNRALTATEKSLLTRYMQRCVPILGGELVTNGTFDTDTWWTKGAVTTIADGVAHVVSAASGQNHVYRINLLPTSKSYYVGYSLSNYVSGRTYFYGYSEVFHAANGAVNKTITWTNDRLGIASVDAGATFDIDNVTAREIL